MYKAENSELRTYRTSNWADVHSKSSWLCYCGFSSSVESVIYFVYDTHISSTHFDVPIRITQVCIWSTDTVLKIRSWKTPLLYKNVCRTVLAVFRLFTDVGSCLWCVFANKGIIYFIDSWKSKHPATWQQSRFFLTIVCRWLFSV